MCRVISYEINGRAFIWLVKLAICNVLATARMDTRFSFLMFLMFCNVPSDYLKKVQSCFVLCDALRCTEMARKRANYCIYILYNYIVPYYPLIEKQPFLHALLSVGICNVPFPCSYKISDAQLGTFGTLLRNQWLTNLQKEQYLQAPVYAPSQTPR